MKHHYCKQFPQIFSLSLLLILKRHSSMPECFNSVNKALHCFPGEIVFLWPKQLKRID